MPPVPNETNDEPAKLGVYDFSDGARLKMTAADAARYQEGLDKAAADRSAWEAVNRGDAPAAAADEPDEAVVPLTILTKAELVELAEKRGLATSGSKSTIAARFAGDDEPEADNADDESDDSDGDAPPAD